MKRGNDLLGVLGLSLCLLACSKPGEDSDAKRRPIAEPAPGIKLPDTLEVPVEVTGKVVQTLTIADLKEHKPDFVDDERQAWRIDTLLSPETFPSGAIVEAVGADGVGISMRHPSNDKMPLPVLFLTRRGVVVAAALRAEDPFPDYHGQGGRLRRPGDPMPRLLSPLARLRVVLPGAESNSVDAKPATMENLQIQIGDGVPTTISAKIISELPSSNIKGTSGEMRTIWNLHDLAEIAVGDGARVETVVGEQELVLAQDQWEDKDKRPVLQSNGRGILKFHWLLIDGSVSADAVHGVTRIIIKR